MLSNINNINRDLASIYTKSSKKTDFKKLLKVINNLYEHLDSSASNSEISNNDIFFDINGINKPLSDILRDIEEMIKNYIFKTSFHRYKIDSFTNILKIVRWESPNLLRLRDFEYNSFKNDNFIYSDIYFSLVIKQSLLEIDKIFEKHYSPQYLFTVGDKYNLVERRSLSNKLRNYLVLLTKELVSASKQFISYKQNKEIFDLIEVYFGYVDISDDKKLFELKAREEIIWREQIEIEDFRVMIFDRDSRIRHIVDLLLYLVLVKRISNNRLYVEFEKKHEYVIWLPSFRWNYITNKYRIDKNPVTGDLILSTIITNKDIEKNF